MAVGILAALNARHESGTGQKIEVSMQEAVLGFMVSSFHQYFTENKVGTRPIQVADGYFTLRSAEVSDEDWPRLARIINRADLIEDGFLLGALEHRDVAHRSEAVHDLVDRHELFVVEGGLVRVVPVGGIDWSF